MTQLYEIWKTTSKNSKIEDDINFLKMEDDLRVLKMEDNIKAKTIEIKK